MHEDTKTLVLTNINFNTTKGDELIENISNVTELSGQGTLDPLDPVKFLF